ncbi:zinc finger MYM-type protein 1-like [Mixophyes fleayi]|uniref:zinc finger MYM-type protein 1-like n=1 Tax=Mixophyes fleayi TaxID=3061075 RepID=UPI003F4D716B
MDLYHHKSGAQKRKEKKAKDKRTSEGRRTLESVGFTVSSHLSEHEGQKEVAGSSTITSGIDEVNENLTVIVLDDDDDDDDVSGSSSMLTCASGTDTTLISEPHTSSAHLTSARKGDVTEVCSTAYSEGASDIELDSNRQLLKCDIGLLQPGFSVAQIEDAVRQGPEPHPTFFPPDKHGSQFPFYILNFHLPNKEKYPRDWLVWSKSKQALFCFPCFLFSKLPVTHRSVLTTEIGWGPSKGYKKLYNKIPDHENSNNHRTCYVDWRDLQTNLEKNMTVDSLLWHKIQNETEVWKALLRRFLDVVLFLAERGLAFRGSSNLIGHPKNGNFLGMLEVVSHYDPLLAEHLKKVKQAQMEKKRLQVHYLSAEIQNEFISCCAEYVFNCILKERENAKYFSIIVDATPDSAHMEQTTFILRYVLVVNNEYQVLERFLEFVNCNKKTGEAIADLILETLQKRNIPINDCRGQGYDNGSNMSGAYKGVQARILQVNSLAIFSPCACHSLNLCGVHAAECCPEVVTFFGIVQKLYNIFSGSPQRWEILKANIGASLHSMSNTRWSARVESVKPFAERLPGIQKAIESVLELNLTSEIRTDLDSVSIYLDSFDCVLMASIWLKVLTAINYRSTVLQARNTTIDKEVENLSSLVDELKAIRNNWQALLNESRLVAENLNIPTEFRSFQQRRQRKRRRFFDESSTEESFSNSTPEEMFKCKVFHILLDSVIGNMTTRFDAAKAINSLFSILWLFPEVEDEEVREKANQLPKRYEDDVTQTICDELIHLKSIYKSNLGEESLSPIKLLNKLKHQKLERLFPNIVVALRLFCTIPVTVAQAERSFSCLSRIKDVLRSTMTQNRLNDLGLLSIEASLARNCDFSSIIDLFSSRKARKALL